MKPAIFILAPSALPLAQKLATALTSTIHAPAELCAKAEVSGFVAYEKAIPHLQQLFRQQQPIIGLCSSAILIRALAPLLHDKQQEPPVIALAEDGSSAVPLLGGHHGANDLARVLAQLCHGHAAITTAGDLRFGLALDQPAPGFVLANPQDAKAATAALLKGAPLALKSLHPEIPPLDFSHLAAGFTFTEATPDFTGVTLETTLQEKSGQPDHLIYHPQALVIGLGCERGVSSSEVKELIAETLCQNNLSPAAVAGFASIDLKQDEPAFADLHPIHFFTAEELARERHRLKTPSEIVAREVGTPGVAEAAALAAAGSEAELLVAKTKSKRATCAIALAPKPLTTLNGSPRGHLSVIGLGPGAASFRSAHASSSLINATDWVGYDLYLDLAADLKTNQQEHRFPLGDEEARCAHALELAKQGKQVALICSGDPGIYAMAALVYELLDLNPSPIAVSVIPGISAFQMASARAGAMIGHDFCCISLSDLLTPWEVIENRIHAAAQGDFVISFYNPRSLKRRDQLEKAITILKSHRPAETPVIIASNLGRPTEQVKIVSLQSFNPAEVDMLTLVMVGSSQSRSLSRGDGKTYAYTPRGYAKKRQAS